MQIKATVKEWIRRFFRFGMRLYYGNSGSEILSVFERQSNQQKAQIYQNKLNQLDGLGAGAYIHESVVITEGHNIQIANAVRIERNVTLYSEGGIVLGEGAHIGAGSIIHSYWHDPVTYTSQLRPVTVEKYAVLGDNVIVYPGVRIGEGATVRSGCIVSQDVPPYAVVAPAPLQIVETRPATFRPLMGGKRTGRQMQDDIFFIPNTGRAGSVSIAESLSQHPQILCTHENHKQLVRLCNEYAVGEKTAEAVRAELKDIYYEGYTYPPHHYGESNHKLFNLIPHLDELFPQSKFVWLIRDGRHVVASLTGRGWYTQQEYAQADPLGEWRQRYMYYRLDGGRTEALTPEAWAAMSPFERNCWYWNYVNRVIERDLQALSPNRHILMRLEDLEARRGELLQFLGVPQGDVRTVHTNKAWYPVKNFKDWSEEETAIFTRWCGDLMDQVYPGWR